MVEEKTSLLILVPSGISVFIEVLTFKKYILYNFNIYIYSLFLFKIWKLFKAFKVKIEFNKFIPSIKVNQRIGSNFRKSILTANNTYFILSLARVQLKKRRQTNMIQWLLIFENL